MRALRKRFAGALEYGDPALVALLATSALVDALVSEVRVADGALVALIAFPLLWRRRAPLLTLVLLIAATYAGYARGPGVGGSVQAWIALSVALYTVAAHGRRARAIAGAALVAAFALAYDVPALVEGSRVVDVAGQLGFLGGVWLLGRWVRRRRQTTHELEQHAARLEADREALAREAVAEERARIAREMHDSVRTA